MNTYAWFVRGDEHTQMARTSIESVRRADREARFVIVTDEKDRNFGIEGINVLHIEPGLPIMVANVEAQLQALHFAMLNGDEQITFLDTDIILLKKISVYRDAMGVVNFTWRDHVMTGDDGEKVEGFAKRMPYNYGVIVALPTLAAIETFIWIRERIRKMCKQHQQWYGNQLAVAQLAGQPPAAGTVVDSCRIPWIMDKPSKAVPIGKLPCEQYNYTPQTPTDDIATKFALHFKGKRRNLMPIYAQRFGLPWYLPTVEEPKVEDLAVVTAL